MSEIGTFLKKQRQNLHLSMKDVYKKTGITDSKLSRIEHGEGKPLTPDELKKLALLYNINVVPLFLMLGFLSEEDLKDYSSGLTGSSLLTEEEHESIQTLINLLTKGRRSFNNDIQIR